MSPESSTHHGLEHFKRAVSIDEAVAPNPRQQSKIIRYFETSNADVLFGGDLETTQDEREAFLQTLAENGIPNQKIIDLLVTIRPPISSEPDKSNPVGLFNRVSLSSQSKAILAHYTHGTISAREDLKPSDLADFVQLYPEPLSFEATTEPFLSGIEYANSPEKRLEYQASLETFKQTVYGKRQEYWDQLKLLISEAAESKNTAITKPTERGELTSQQIKQLLDWTEIHGDTYQDQDLTRQILEQQGLAPKYMVEVGDIKLAFSDIYQFEGDRTAVIGYTQPQDGRVVARTYYLSQSQGLWRYLPSYASGWFDKGHSEDSLNLPAEAQALLGGLSMKPAIEVEDPELVFYGTARGPERGGITYKQETGRDPDLLEGNFYSARTKDQILSPEQIGFSNQLQAPNYSKLEMSWKSVSGLYGPITSDVYLSNDGQYRYIFNTDAKGRTWIADVENNSKIMSTGVREKWTAGGDLVMPLYEYYEQSGGYGVYEPEAGRYVQMWDEYISKTPVMQEYLRFKEKK